MPIRTLKSSSVCSVLTGVCLGAVAMYFFDPQTGRRRRALVRDQVTHAMNVMVELEGTQRKDLANRVSRLWHSLTSPLRRHDDSDDAVNARVRARLGHVVLHPDDVETRVQGGRVILTGSIDASQLDRMLEEIRRVPGAKEIDNRLAVKEACDIPPSQSNRQASPVS